MQAWNRELELAVTRYPNLKIYDWASVAQTAWFSSDRIHYTPEGYRQRARLIADALATAYPSTA
jgi:lysophospholipase L1-like esterase